MVSAITYSLKNYEKYHGECNGRKRARNARFFIKEHMQKKMRDFEIKNLRACYAQRLTGCHVDSFGYEDM